MPTLRSSILTGTLISLAACGGGGTDNSGTDNSGTDNSPVGRYSVLTVFSDGSGVGRGVFNSDGSQLVFIGPEITQAVAGLSQVTPSDLVDIQYSDFPITSTTSTANIHEGTTTSQGTTVNVFAVVDKEGEALMALLTVPSSGDSLGLAGGTAYGSAPLGEFTYLGTQGIVNRGSTATPELGTFSLTANFGERTFSYDGSSTNSAVSGSGIIDTVNGRFATSTLDVTANDADYTGTMHGLLHGSSSQSVSGVFHTNEDNPTYAGAFVGSR